MTRVIQPIQVAIFALNYQNMNQPTQTDVARQAGVSRATVSYVINGLTDGKIPISDETRRRVLNAIEELGYEPDEAVVVGDTPADIRCARSATRITSG